MNVYLAGAITGLDYDTAAAWRFRAINALRDIGINGIDPFRFDYKDETKKLNTSVMQGFEPIKSIPRRNLDDIQRSWAIFANLSVEGPRVSFGTVAEIAWGFYLRKPVFTIFGPLHDSEYLRELTTFVCQDFRHAINMISIAKVEGTSV